VGQTQLGNFLSSITNQSNNTRENGKVPFVVDRWQRAAIYQQQKVLSHFPVCCWIDWFFYLIIAFLQSTQDT
jgi:hypothetical protein